MKILQLMFSRGRGGLERVFADHASLLAQRGHLVHSVILKDAGFAPELSELALRNSQTIVVHAIDVSGWRRLLLPFRLYALLVKIQPDVLIGHGAKVVHRLSILRPRRIPLFAVTHNDSPQLSRATHLIALTTQLKQLFLQRGFPASRIHEIPNALPGHSCGLLPPHADAGGTGIVIGTLSRLVHKKGIDIVLRAFRIALDRGLRARLVIGGDGPQRPELEALTRSLQLQQQVTFAGWVSDPGSFYCGIDWCCIASREEPFGLVALESFAHGVPVLAAAVGGLTEIVADGVNGKMFRGNDTAALADALLAIQAQPHCNAAIRAAAYVSLQRYQPERIAAAIEIALQAGLAELQYESAWQRRLCRLGMRGVVA